MKLLAGAPLGGEYPSLPARGAWIETVLIDNMLRGKLVAPRTGGVD